MLIDEVIIDIMAGSGGNGVVAFDKNKWSQGPVGGYGGNGGNVYFEGTSDLSALQQFRFKKEARAENGQDGRGQLKDGADGEDLALKVPVGTVIHNLNNGGKKEIVKVGERILVAKGGKGGRGNYLFRSSTNVTPKEFEYGEPGESFKLKLELKLIADVGIIGLPNAGKSSLLNELTSAKSKVANYPFTTLEPNLGVSYGIILADIPGLIEGASSGKGLGIKFLRHIERTKVIFHLISAESPDAIKDYKTIRQELEKYNKELLKKQEYLFLSKSDAVGASELSKKLAELTKINPSATPISIYDFESIERIKKILGDILKQK